MTKKNQRMKMYDDIRQMRRILREEIRKKHDRVLPFGEEMSDRREKAKYLRCGKGTTIYDSSIVFGDVKIGKNTWVGPFTVLDGSGGLIIGNNCGISSGVQIYTHDTVKWRLSGGKTGYAYAPVKIKDNCHIAPGSIISKGVTIGAHCLIGFHALILKDIPDNSIVFGVPGKIVGKVVIGKKGKIKLVYK
ncbi:acyltransferase [Candidatus Omnitrophota bacterium]